MSRWRTLSNPLVPKRGKILSHRLKQNKKTPQQSSLSLLSPLYFPLFLKSSTIDLSSSPLKEMACGKTASDLVAEVKDEENEIKKSTQYFQKPWLYTIFLLNYQLLMNYYHGCSQIKVF